MKIHRSHVFAAVLFGLSTIAQAALFENSRADLQAEAKAAGKEGKNLAVLLTLPDCHGCKDMETRVYPDKAIEKDFSRKFRSVRLDISQETELVDPSGKRSTPAQFATRLRAVGTPSFVFFDAKGTVLYRHTGKLDAAGFKQLASYVSRGEYEHRPFQIAAAGDHHTQKTESDSAPAAHSHQH